ncbi:MAG: S-methyl-5'-thioadenosine phosphorylase [Rubellimicrobium sp.]|nr:S-methyl-5'-thioadenosine phosphorylase [Rubellimicrobium sp.]
MAAADGERVIGIIGGSGIYEVAGIGDARRVAVASPFGTPSDDILTGHVAGVRMAFLPRHGRGHVHSPDSVPYRANIDAMKRLGVTDLVSLSAVGSLREDVAPGDFLIPDQFIDRTRGRVSSFFGQGCVAHVGMAHPVCAHLARAAAQAVRAAGARVHEGGAYLAMEGPQFSTRAESVLYRQWGASVIGMTNMPEAKLAREAEICYASVAMVTDYDCWHDGHDAVDVTTIIRTLAANAATAREVVALLPAILGATRAPCAQGCDHALDHAIMTAPAQRDPAVLARLDAVAGRVL